MERKRDLRQVRGILVAGGPRGKMYDATGQTPMRASGPQDPGWAGDYPTHPSCRGVFGFAHSWREAEAIIRKPGSEGWTFVMFGPRGRQSGR